MLNAVVGNTISNQDISHRFYASSTTSAFDHPNNIEWGVQIINPLAPELFF